MSVLFKFITTVSIFFIYLLISSFSGTYLITSPFLVLFALKTLNDLFINFFSCFTHCLSISVWVDSESTSALSHNCQEYSIKYIYSTSQMLKLSLTLHTLSITGLLAGLFLTIISFYLMSLYLCTY